MGCATDVEPTGFDRLVGVVFAPDPGTEDMFIVEDNIFAFSPGELSRMFNPKSCAAFHALGGLAGLGRGLRTDVKAGLSVDEADDTRTDPRGVFDKNAPPGVSTVDNNPFAFTPGQLNKMFKPKNLSAFYALGGLDGLEKGLRTNRHTGLTVDEVGNNHNESETVFGKNILPGRRRKQDRVVRVVRSGRTAEISVFDILVGDILQLEPGDLIPADGILVSGDSVICDESCMTGESDPIKKTPGVRVDAAIASSEDPSRVDPFIMSGTRVMEGIGTFMVTSVGVHSAYGKNLMWLFETDWEWTDSKMSWLLRNTVVLLNSLSKLCSAVALFRLGTLALERISTTVPDSNIAQWFFHWLGRAMVEFAHSYSLLDLVGLALMFGLSFLAIYGTLEATIHAEEPATADYLRFTVYLGFLYLAGCLGSHVPNPNNPLFWVNVIMDSCAAFTLATIATKVIWSFPSDIEISASYITARRTKERCIWSNNSSTIVPSWAEVSDHQIRSLYGRLTTLTLRWIPTYRPVMDKHNPISILQGVLMISWAVLGLLLSLALISGVIIEPPGHGPERGSTLPNQVHWLEPTLNTFLLYGAIERGSKTPPDRLLLLLLHASRDSWISLHIAMILLLMGTVLLRPGDGLPPLELAAHILKICDRVNESCFHVNSNPGKALDGLCWGAMDNLIFILRRVIKVMRRKTRSRPPCGSGVSSRNPVRVGASKVLLRRAPHEGGTPHYLGGRVTVGSRDG